MNRCKPRRVGLIPRTPDFRTLEARDWQDVEVLETACFAPPLGRDRITAMLRPESMYAWYGLCTGPGGWGTLPPYRIAAYVCGVMPADVAQVVRFGCLPAVRRQGLGTLLMLNFLQVAAISLMSVVQLEVQPGNRQAVRMYENLGFERIGLRPRYYPNGEPALLYNLLDLQAPVVQARLAVCLDRTRARVVESMKEGRVNHGG